MQTVPLGQPNKSMNTTKPTEPAPDRHEASRPSLAQMLIEDAHFAGDLEECDNRKLLWLAMQTKSWKDAPILGKDAAILAEIESRLYPEYDGDKVKATEWGWDVCGGEVRYALDHAQEQPAPEPQRAVEGSAREWLHRDNRTWPHPDHAQHIIFEGGDSIVIAPEDYQSLLDDAEELADRAEVAERELERERMRLCACGVVALSDTPSSATEARQMHPDYESGSCDDVKRRVDECIMLRVKLAKVEEQRDTMRNQAQAEAHDCRKLQTQLAAAQAEARKLREALEWLENEAPQISHYSWSCSVDMSGNRWTIQIRNDGKRERIRGRTLVETIEKARAALTQNTDEQPIKHNGPTT